MDIAAWTARVDQEHEAGNLTRAMRDALTALASFFDYAGLFPSQTAIAERARCHVRTVRRALKMAATLGMAYWTPRTKREGWRKLPDTHRYFLNVPDRPVKPGMRPVLTRPATTGQTDPLQANLEKEERKRLGKELARMAVTGPRQLELVAIRRQRDFNASWLAQRSGPPRWSAGLTNLN